ncbi:MAG TPA: bifunctional glutamate N-acetyltransferase/amino-acid acetyltransferase ArgJ [Acidimicrobiia bacterium]|nr:bifunctional glutamate N-acetyltransferase/amino-acid acetyltransferase ArgJ [Acidimicrobiia bacterium]
MSVTAARGFVAGGLACGIKPSGRPDLAIVATADHAAVSAAGVFTSNLVAAAPVQVSRAHLHDARAAAVVLNSGNANAATGEAGRRDALRMAELTGAGLSCAPRDVLVCSTGLIGIPMPIDPVVSGIPKLVTTLNAEADGGAAAADAILTTDTVRKETEQRVALANGVTATIGGMAKGAAMLSPALATMLAVLTTDAAVDPTALRAMLTAAVTDSFNSLIVDDCTSTNDTVLVLANGALGNEPIARTGRAYEAFAEALATACADLARQMAADAEGATKLATITVRGARSAAEARTAARAVARSQLVQCSLYGQDPYWGRVLSELGASGARFDPERVDIAYQGIEVCHDGVAAAHDETALAGLMEPRDIRIEADLHAGTGSATVTFTDLTHAYVDENMGTS